MSSVLCSAIRGVLLCCSWGPVRACIALDRGFPFSTCLSTRLHLFSPKIAAFAETSSFSSGVCAAVEPVSSSLVQRLLFLFSSTSTRLLPASVGAVLPRSPLPAKKPAPALPHPRGPCKLKLIHRDTSK